ncbi:hypothetical protein N0649_06980 [Pseudomonas aeruginosa]|nr:hypothetical protein [Pseudomonas aeruginosa]MCT1150151.1 hypothetical protein [Pseudomonas aeruginosa]MCT1157764.1 hypothetical protein [Pseudomonas aeruginosa]
MSKNHHTRPPIGTPDIPESTPSPTASAWNMQAITQLTASVARLEQSIEHLAEKIGDLKQDQQTVVARVESVERKLLFAAAVVTVVMAIGTAAASFAGYVGNKAIDFGLEMAKDRLSAVDEAPSKAPTALRSK